MNLSKNIFSNNTWYTDYGVLKIPINEGWDKCASETFNLYAAGGLFGLYQMMQNPLKIIKTLANGYSSDSAQWELSYEYPDDLVRMISKFFRILVHWAKVTSASEGLRTRPAH